MHMRGVFLCGYNHGHDRNRLACKVMIEYY